MSRARNLGNLGNENLISGDTANLRVGINSTLPTTKLDVDGNITATAFFGDGSNLEGVASAGLGTALSDDGTGSVIYYTNTVLGIGSTMVVDPPSTTKVAYTQYADISVDENVDLIVVEGDDFVPDILGLSTEGATELTGVGGRIRAGSFTDKAGTGAPKLTFGAEVPVGVAVTGAGGINVAGFATAGGFVGNLTGNVTGNASGSSGSCSGNAATATVATNAQGLTGSPNISVGTITASGSVSIGGTLTYEDVTNIDSVGIITARNGVDFKGVLREKVKITAGKLSDNTQINLDDGMVHLFTTQETTTSTPNITSSVGINTIMAVGDTMTLSVITTAAAGAFSANWTVDHTAVTEAWNGGAAPAAGGAAGKDFYTLNIIKTGNAAFTVLGNVSNFA